jgi:shikimate dehydrogenase
MEFKAAVLGSPIAHSLSPKIHNYIYQRLNFPGIFERVEVGAGQLERFLLSQKEYAAFALTAPLKEELFLLAKGQDWSIANEVARMKSANTLLWGEEKKIYSSDYLATLRLLGAKKGLHKIGILGAGGTTRAILGALDELQSNADWAKNLEVNIRNRTLEKITSLKNDFPRLNICALPFNFTDEDENGWAGELDLLINTLAPEVFKSHEGEILAAAVESSDHPKYFFDCIYANSRFGSFAERFAKDSLITGLDLLVEQALDQAALMMEASASIPGWPLAKIEFDYSTLRLELLDRLSQ